MARKMLRDGEVAVADGSGAEEESYDYDLFVIGAGSGGVRGSRTSAGFGAKVAICELPFHPISSEWLGGHGGTCVIRGCVPKKILVYGASFRGEFEASGLTVLCKKWIQSNSGGKSMGTSTTTGKSCWKTRKQNVSFITSVFFWIVLTYTSGNIHLQELAITSDEALSLEELPKRAVILGGGYIAVEFASIWRGLGAEVDLFYRKELPLSLQFVLSNSIYVNQLSKTADGIKVVTDKGDELIADVVLFATGRAPNSNRLNLEAVGVEVDQVGAIKVDEYSRTSVPNIWAVGDVTNRINLTPVALMEATCFSKTVFGGQPIKPDYKDVPCAVFCIPPLSVVGLSEQEALEEAKNDILVYTSSFNPMKNSISKRQEKSVMKLVVDAETDKVLGAAMSGPDAAEIMQGIAVALKAGATKATFDSTVGIHPSAAEEFVTMRTLTRRVSPASKPKTNL
ncbi:hypothetical protein ACQ4PT_029020 [Festuca glaucescens]